MKPTQEQVIAWAEEASGGRQPDGWGVMLDHEQLERFAALVAAAEREACAKTVEEWLHGEWHNQGVVAALMIRERGAP